MKLYVEINSEIYTQSIRRIILILSVLSASSKNTDGQNQRTFTKSPRYVQTLYNALCTNASFKLQTVILTPLRSYSFRYTKNIISTFTLLNSRFQSYYNISLIYTYRTHSLMV